MKKVLVWLSGWVDSAVSAYLLKKAAYDVTAWFMINYLDEENPNCPTKIDLEIAKEVAKFLEIPFFTFDYRDIYEEKVLKYLYEWYKNGITPNPDIMCNKEIKFKMFLEEALDLWFDYIATGHYARIERVLEDKRKDEIKKSQTDRELEKNNFSLIKASSEILENQKISISKINSERQLYQNWELITHYSLLKWIDKTKDQSYFLAFLNQFQLSKTLFPIWNLEKNEVRKIAEEIWLPNAKRKDSQWICFVGKVNFKEFLEKKIKHKEWNIIDTSWKILWKHKWVFYYTIWQRKWIDVWWLKEAVFVVKKDIKNNVLIVWTTKDLNLYSKKLYCQKLHFINEKFKILKEFKAKAKIRYRQADQDVEIKKLDKWTYEFNFKEAQRAIASGQIVAIYIWEELVASWIIS